MSGNPNPKGLKASDVLVVSRDSATKRVTLEFPEEGDVLYFEPGEYLSLTVKPAAGGQLSEPNQDKKD